jgi:hypothetical protein
MIKMSCHQGTNELDLKSEIFVRMKSQLSRRYFELCSGQQSGERMLGGVEVLAKF